MSISIIRKKNFIIFLRIQNFFIKNKINREIIILRRITRTFREKQIITIVCNQVIFLKIVQIFQFRKKIEINIFAKKKNQKNQKNK